MDMGFVRKIKSWISQNNTCDTTICTYLFCCKLDDWDKMLRCKNIMATRNEKCILCLLLFSLNIITSCLYWFELITSNMQKYIWTQRKGCTILIKCKYAEVLYNEVKWCNLSIYTVYIPLSMRQHCLHSISVNEVSLSTFITCQWGNIVYILPRSMWQHCLHSTSVNKAILSTFHLKQWSNTVYIPLQSMWQHCLHSIPVNWAT